MQTIIYIGPIHYITHIHLKSPKYKIPHYYTWNNAIFILLSGDIEKHPGPLAQLIVNLPAYYSQKQRQYLTQNTLTFQSHYSHLEKSFEPYLTQNSPNTLWAQIDAHMRC